MSSALNATLRLQFHKGFSLDDAVQWVPYYARMGISHVYASPVLSARAGSMHGYDVVDPTQVNPELGGEPALRRLVAALREHGMGLILDIVSNHMAVGGDDNPWWLDLLEWGRRSPYSTFFDIQWHSPDPLLEGQLLLPFLGNDYALTLQDGSLALHFEAASGGFFMGHYQHRFPICPTSYAELLDLPEVPELKALGDRFSALHYQHHAHDEAPKLREALAELARQPHIAQALEKRLADYDGREPEGLQRLHQLLEKQHYRLASWRTAADDINWRRFFDINELGGLRVERPEVFEATHRKIFQLIEDGLIDGLRIDHIDGLADPRAYCRKLRRRVDRLAPGRHLPIYVEKILGHGERLPNDWNVDGTTGYEFMNQLSLLQHAPAGQAPLAALWSRHSERPADFSEEVRLARQQVLNGSLGGDFESVAQALLQVARDDIFSRDLTLGAIRRALLELVVHFPVYRTYISAYGRSAADDQVFQQAMDGARQTLGEADWAVLDTLQRWLGGETWRKRPVGRSRKLLKHACVRFQQLTSPTAAKAVEDTAFYRSAVLLSRNDVGFTTETFSAPLSDFHDACQERLARFPHNLLTSATHDHKRGEDTRARLAVLSERADWYAEQVEHWRGLAATLRSDPQMPSAGDELILYQVLLGSWPLDLDPEDHAALKAYRERLGPWQEKALREAKLNSHWSAPNEAYERASQGLLDGILLHPEGRVLRQSLAAAVQSIAAAGALNSLAQTLLRNTVPGVPDLYQGNEFWDFSLVDPDNRRPVDFRARQQALTSSTEPARLLDTWRDGHLKQSVVAHSLALRAAHPLLFSEGSYQPLEVLGEQANRVLAFARERDGQFAVVVVPVRVAGLLENSAAPRISALQWGDTRVVLPFSPNPKTFKGLFPSSAVTPHKELLIRDALGEFPVNLFTQT